MTNQQKEGIIEALVEDYYNFLCEKSDEELLLRDTINKK